MGALDAGSSPTPTPSPTSSPTPAPVPVPTPTPTPLTPELHPHRWYDCSTVDGDPDQLRGVARLWRSAADELKTQVEVLDANVWFWSDSWNGQGKQQFAEVWEYQFAGVYSSKGWACPSPIDPATGKPRGEPMFEACITGCLSMAQALEKYASDIEQARQDQINHMLVIGAVTVVTIGVGLLTFGVGDLLVGGAATALTASGIIAEDSLLLAVGTYFAMMTVSAVSGFTAGFAGDVTSQFFKNLIKFGDPGSALHHIDLNESLGAGEQGAAAGAAAFVVGSGLGKILSVAGAAASLETTVVVGSLTGFTVSAGTQLLQNGRIDLGQLGLDTALSGFTAGLVHQAAEPQWLSFQTADGQTVDIGVRPLGGGRFNVVNLDGDIIGQGVAGEGGITARFTIGDAPMTLAFDGQTGSVTFGSLEPGGRALTFSPVEAQTVPGSDGIPTTAIRYEPTGGIQTDLAGGQTFYDAHGNLVKTVSSEGITTVYRNGEAAQTTFPDGSSVSLDHTVDAGSPSLDPAGPGTSASPTGIRIDPQAVGADQPPESVNANSATSDPPTVASDASATPSTVHSTPEAAGWGTNSGDLAVPGPAPWTWDTLPRSGTVQPNQPAQPSSAPRTMDPAMAARADPILRALLDADGRSIVNPNGQIRSRFPVDFDPEDPRSFARVRDLMGSITWATGRETVLVAEGEPLRFEIRLGGRQNVSVPGQQMVGYRDGTLVPPARGEVPNILMTPATYVAHSHPYGESHLPSYQIDASGKASGDIPTLQRLGGDLGYIVAHPTADPNDPWVVTEYEPNGDWRVVASSELEMPFRRPWWSRFYENWQPPARFSPTDVSNRPTQPLPVSPDDVSRQPTQPLPLSATDPTDVTAQPTRPQPLADIPPRPAAPPRPRLGPIRLEPLSGPRPEPRSEPGGGPSLLRTSPLSPGGESQPLLPMTPIEGRRGPGGFAGSIWQADRNGNAYLVKPAATNSPDTVNEVLARAIQNSAGVKGPPVYFGGPPGDPATPALIRDIENAMPGAKLEPKLTSILGHGDLISHTLDGPDPNGVLRRVIFDYLTNNFFDPTPDNVLVVTTNQGPQIIGIDYAMAFGHELAPGIDEPPAFTDLLRPRANLSVSKGENWSAHWVDALRQALVQRAGPGGEALLAQQLDQIINQYRNVSVESIVKQLRNGHYSPAGSSLGITPEQESYVRKWLQEFETRVQWLKANRDQVLQELWKGHLRR